MAIKKATLGLAIDEAHRFIKKAVELQDEHPDTGFETYHGCPKEQAAVLRSSMDLTRTLADLRQER